MNGADRSARRRDVLAFTLDGRAHALRLSSVSRIVRAVEVRPLPQAPGVVLGVIDVAGVAVPVMDLRARFGLPRRSIVPADRFILARASGRPVALPVDAVRGVISLPDDAVVPGAAADAASGAATDAAAMVRSLLSAPITRAQSDVLATHLTVGETYFFREKEVLDALEEHALRGGAARIWCAGCSTGEEAYSIALILDSLDGPGSGRARRILATDINIRSLHCAREGTYGTWSFRAMVDFMYHNLAEDPFPSLLNATNAMDLILCRNVLLYFQPALRQRVVESFCRALVDGGCLAVGSVETAQIKAPGLLQAVYGDATFFRKTPVEPVDSRAPLAMENTPAAPFHPAPAAKPHGPLAQQAPAAARGAPASDPEAHAGEARDLADKGELEEALRRGAMALARDRTNPAYHFLYASILQELGRPEDAAAALRRALFLDKGFVIARFAMGQVARTQGRTAESRRHFAAALETLGAYAESDFLPESEGITAGGLAVTIRHMIQEETES